MAIALWRAVVDRCSQRQARGLSTHLDLRFSVTALVAALVIAALGSLAPAPRWGPRTWRSRFRIPQRVLLPVILVAASVSRLTLVLAGGQFYWPDEGRYEQSRIMVEDLTAGVPLRAWEFEHPLFNVIGMLPAAIESAYVRDARIPAVFFAMFSVLNIWLLSGISRRLGAGHVESMLVAALFAASTSFLYFVRHLFPYDLSMTFGLLALRAAITSTAPRASLVCGAWAGLCFLTYFGYWTFGGAACVIHVFQNLDWKTLVRRGVVTAAGLAIPLLFIAGSPMASGGDVIAGTVTFMDNVNQGTFA